MKIETNINAISLQNKIGLMELAASNKTEITANNLNGNFNQVSFADTFDSMVHSVNGQQLEAAQAMASVDAGRSDDLVGAMVLSQKAGLSLSVLMQVRNKVMSGFDDIMRMPI